MAPGLPTGGDVTSTESNLAIVATNYSP
ncbi:hypothetical protein ARSEF1564_009537 [Beauveria bassiana]